MEKEMGFFEAVSQVIRKSFVFKGRARRKEFWSWSLFVALVAFVLAIVFCVVTVLSPDSVWWMMALLYLFALVVFFPSLSVTFRRLHDVGRSGWWYGGYYLVSVIVGLFVSIFTVASIAKGAETNDVEAMVGAGIAMSIYGMVAFAYSVLLLIWSFTEGTEGPNKYGEDPKRE